MYSPAPLWLPNLPVITPYHDCMAPFGSSEILSPTSQAWASANLAIFYPIYLPEPFTVSKAFWCNGATVGTDSLDIGVYQMTNMSTGRLDLIRSTGAVLSAGTASVVQEVGTWKVAATHLLAGSDSTDASSYTLSVTMKAGRLYLLAITNTAASAAAVSTITGGGTWSSRASTQFNGTAHRVSIWSCVPTADYTASNLTIDFGATQTGWRWAFTEFSGVNTATTDGVVQGVTGTGSSVTPLATLAAFGSANNATFGALANTADSTTTPGSGFTELSDDTSTVTPASFMQTEWRVDNDTTVDGTITSGPWGACAVEIKADNVSPFIIPPSMPGAPNIYMGFAVSGTTATILTGAGSPSQQRARGVLEKTSGFPLPSNVTPSTGGNSRLPLAGFSSRSLIG